MPLQPDPKPSRPEAIRKLIEAGMMARKRNEPEHDETDH